MKKKIVIGLSIYGAGFLLFFIFRLIYGYASYPSISQQRYRGGLSFSNINIRNYASSKLYMKKIYQGKGGGAVTVDQKYERVASLQSVSGKYKKAEKKLRKTIKEFNALIQFEQKSGLKGYRSLIMAIGVSPEKFDDMVKKVSTIGKITSKNITKKDKTNEYKDLKAKKKSLLKIRQSLLALKNRGGKIAEYITLENRILEIENKIQKLGVNLGEYDSENEFCTIKFSLKESTQTYTISFIHRVKVAIEWSIKYYLFLNILGIIVLLSVLISIKILAYLDFIPGLIREQKDKLEK